MTLITTFAVWGPLNRVLEGQTGYDAFALIWTSILLAMSLWLLGMPLWAAIVAYRLIYTITDRRLLIIGAFPFKRLASYSPGEIGAIETSERPDGSGNIIFRNDQQIVRNGMRLNVSFRVDYYTGFFGVSDVRRVEDAVRDLARKKAPAAI